MMRAGTTTLKAVLPAGTSASYLQSCASLGLNQFLTRFTNALVLVFLSLFLVFDSFISNVIREQRAN